jgi:hypothetical protein
VWWRNAVHLELASELAACELGEELDRAELVNAAHLGAPLRMLRVGARTLVIVKCTTARILVLLKNAPLLPLWIMARETTEGK